ncbi:PREDICTED: uncharacterized protein LOC109471319 [Branchiostoma belcheri]|uniref:Uncharacterized protein LOC109471319 n=1 Tax=Branchiostoma belcheri TaxID=7741 RepID=A0A6P4YP54_BRABE|nr:PREDICTED: uncharacterized protein LOC109471319 [Branchiostoma belcheri]
MVILKTQKISHTSDVTLQRFKCVKTKKKENPRAGPSRICHAVMQAVGTSTSVDTQCKMPRGQKQIFDINRKSNYDKAVGIAVDDPFFRALSLMQNEDPKDKFYQTININSTPQSSAHLLYNKRQINDISMFCSGDNFSILSADITFQLGPFWVLTTCYRHLDLKVKGTDASPVMIGPMLRLAA